MPSSSSLLSAWLQTTIVKKKKKKKKKKERERKKGVRCKEKQIKSIYYPYNKVIVLLHDHQAQHESAGQLKSHGTSEEGGQATFALKDRFKINQQLSMGLPKLRDHTKTNHRESLLPSILAHLDLLQHRLKRAPLTRCAVLAQVIAHPLGPFLTVSTNPRLSWRDLSPQPWHRAEPALSPLHRARRYHQQTPSMKSGNPEGES